jgi:hypothetical protein
MRLLPLALGLVLLLGGCSHYRLGSGAAPKFATLFIAPVTSDVLVPHWRTVLNTQLREAFIRDGRVTLVSRAEEADAVLQVHLTAYDRTATVGQSQDTGLARRFDVNLRAQATLLDRRSDQAYFTNRPLTATRGVFIDGGLAQSEYQTLPLIAAALAEQALHAALDTW